MNKCKCYVQENRFFWIAFSQIAKLTLIFEKKKFNLLKTLAAFITIHSWDKNKNIRFIKKKYIRQIMNRNEKCYKFMLLYT